MKITNEATSESINLPFRWINSAFDFAVKSFCALFGGDDCDEAQTESICLVTFDYLVKQIAETTGNDPEELQREILKALDAEGE